jgi:signal transduction histidine kinase
MEACCGAHFLGRAFEAQGHMVRLMSPEYVQPYVKAQKTDDRDAEAIAEAATRPTMRFVSLKSEVQLDLQALHRARERQVLARTSLINQFRAVLLERGITLPKGRGVFMRRLDKAALDTLEVSIRTRQPLNELLDECATLDRRIKAYDEEFGAMTRNDHCRSTEGPSQRSAGGGSIPAAQAKPRTLPPHSRRNIRPFWIISFRIKGLDPDESTNGFSSSHRSGLTCARLTVMPRGPVVENDMIISRIVLRLIGGALLCLVAASTAASSQPLPRSILVISEAATGGPFYPAIVSSFQSTLSRASPQNVSLYLENLGLSQFQNPRYEKSLREFLAAKYGDRPIGVVVALGKVALDYVLRQRNELWPNVPVVFTLVGRPAVAKLQLPPDVTGHTATLTLADMVDIARAVVPDLSGVALVGDRMQDQVAYQHFVDEMPALRASGKLSDLTGLSMRELKTRLASLPDKTAILYTAIYSDGEGAFFPPVDGLKQIAAVANRPIIGSVGSFLGEGIVGGKIIMASALGEEAARLALRILDGEKPSAIPITEGKSTRPAFDWRQLQRWNVDLSRLPAGSEIRFRPPSAWEQYKIQIVIVLAVLLIQTLLISRLLYERRLRRIAETESLERADEIAYMNRTATAGELSASIAHEVKQPLAAIMANAGAALRWLGKQTPNIEEARFALKRMLDEGHRASQVIDEIRGMFRKDNQERKPVDVNALISESLLLVDHEIQTKRIVVRTALKQDQPSRVVADRIQLQQVILNLVVNAIEAIQSITSKPRILLVSTTATDNSGLVVTVEDSGPGIDPENTGKVFEMFFTTKPKGMGIGLAMCRSIVESHGGRIEVSRSPLGGCKFQIHLPNANN